MNTTTKQSFERTSKKDELDSSKELLTTEKIDLVAVQQNGMALEFIKNPTPEICLAAVQQHGWALKYVTNQTPELCLAAVRQDGLALRYVHNQTPELCLAAVQQHGWALKYVINQTLEICLAATQEDGFALTFVKDQTPELCLAAVQQDGLALKHVKDQTPEICLAAVQQDGLALRFVKNQTVEICLAAVRQHGFSLQYVKEQTPELCLAAIQENSFALEFVENRTLETYLAAIQQTSQAFELITPAILNHLKREGTLLVRESQAQNKARHVKAYQYKGDWYFFVGCQRGISKEYFIERIHDDGGLERHPHRQYYLDFLTKCVENKQPDKRIIKQKVGDLFDKWIIVQIEDFIKARKNGLHLKYIENQTQKICLAAVQQNGLALEYVMDQTPKVCLAAVKENGWALKYVTKQTVKICLAAVQQTPKALIFFNSAILAQLKKDGTLLVKELKAQGNARHVKAYQYKGKWYFFVGCQHGISKERFKECIRANGGLKKHPHRQYYLDFLAECVA